MKYLYIEKRQNVDLKEEWPNRAMRMIEEFEAANLDFAIAYNDSFEIDFTDGETIIRFDGHDLRDFTHIFFGGHRSETRWDYEIKVIVATYCKTYNKAHVDAPIHLQNQEFILKMPYYDKLHMAFLCMQHGIPHLNTYYRRDGNYSENIENYGGYPTIAKHVWGVNDRVEIDGKNMVKKNVFKIDDADEWQQARLADKRLSQFFTQQFSQAGEDYRIFVSKGKVVGGWKRISLDDSFMTVGGERKYELYNNPAPEILEICEKASNAWGVDFMALDFIYAGNQPVVLEFSMHPGFKAYETKTEAPESDTEQKPINVAKTIIESF